jgi:rhodanese-related sulfurtransferase
MRFKEAHQLRLAGKAVIVDVREAAELSESGMAEGALWMPTSKISEEPEEWEAFREQLPRAQMIFLYCRSGARSGRVAEMLCMLGFQAENLGSFADWKNRGLPVSPFKG